MIETEVPTNMVGRDPQSSRRAKAWLALCVAIGVVACITLGWFFATGWRAFIVSTPSMGMVAPVGSLVITQPAALDQIEIGDIVTFRPHGGHSSYTHRVVAHDAAGLTTRGDINGSADPWIVTQDHIIGRAAVVAPVWGWVLRGLPILIIIGMLGHLLTQRIRDDAVRRASRVVGAIASLSVTALILRPFVGFQVLTTQAADAGTNITAVSTGILPISMSTPAGQRSPAMASGEVVSFFGTPDATGRVSLSAGLDLTWWQWIVLIAVCLGPLMWFLVFGFGSRGTLEWDNERDEVVEVG